jgi:hypothetical protein
MPAQYHTPRPCGSTGQSATRLNTSHLFILELQFLVAANKTARPALTGLRRLAAVNALLGDCHLNAAVFTVVDITFFHFTARWHLLASLSHCMATDI